MFKPQAATLAVVLVASLAGGGTAAANFGTDPSADRPTAVTPETNVMPVMDLPNGCEGDDWSFESSVD